MPSLKSAATPAARKPRGRPAALAGKPALQSPAKPPGKAAPSYHHGDLRAALLRAAGELLEERGLEGFTLRECARRAGVSHGAPAHHFGDAAGMLTAYAAAGFARMTALMRDYQAQAEQDGASRLKAAGLAYIDFAVAHRAQFQLMFRSDRLNQDDADFCASADAAFEALGSAMRAAAPRAAADQAGLGDRMLLAWSVVHGFATLLLEGELSRQLGKLTPRQYARATGERLLALLQPALREAGA